MARVVFGVGGVHRVWWLRRSSVDRPTPWAQRGGRVDVPRRLDPGELCASDRATAFCGVGGLSHGFRRVGFRVSAGIEVDKTCKHAFGSRTWRRGGEGGCEPGAGSARTPVDRQRSFGAGQEAESLKGGAQKPRQVQGALRGSCRSVRPGAGSSDGSDGNRAGVMNVGRW